jgi:hypothetical protein
MEPANNRLPPICERCASVMQAVGQLPQLGFRPGVQVFKCSTCRIVETKELSTS